MKTWSHHNHQFSTSQRTTMRGCRTLEWLASWIASSNSSMRLRTFGRQSNEPSEAIPLSNHWQRCSQTSNRRLQIKKRKSPSAHSLMNCGRPTRNIKWVLGKMPCSFWCSSSTNWKAKVGILSQDSVSDMKHRANAQGTQQNSTHSTYFVQISPA